MAKSSLEEEAALAIGLIYLAALILIAILASIFVLPVVLVLVVAWILWCNHRKSDGYREKLARRHTEELYRAAQALAPKWPNKEEFGREVYAHLPSVPETVEDVMLEVALDLYDEEHCEAELPPGPAICNSLDGQHYRDFLAAYSAKAHNPQAPRLAIEALAEAFTAFAEHIPTLHGGARLVFEVPFAGVIDAAPAGARGGPRPAATAQAVREVPPLASTWRARRASPIPVIIETTKTTALVCPRPSAGRCSPARWNAPSPPRSAGSRRAPC